jgi:hypothetical protein
MIKKLKFIKHSYNSEKEMVLFQKSIILDSCYTYDISPRDWITMADSDLFMELGNLLTGRSHYHDDMYFEHLYDLYQEKKRLNPFINTESEITFHQKVVFNYCINHTIRLIDVSKLTNNSKDIRLDFIDIFKSLDFLQSNNYPLIKKPWEKELLDYLK